MSGYDVIGDVHGHVDRLEALLRRLGYHERQGTWRHSERTAVFVGDIIDRRRGQQRATLRFVRRMVDDGSAKIVLGNHEFNAVAYATTDPARRGYCRPHNAKNLHQHREFLDEIGFDSAEHRSAVAWFRTIPLWLDLDGLRVVHACWNQADIEHLRAVCDADHTLNDAVVIDGTTEGTGTHRAVEHVLKGPEIDIAGHSYVDKDGQTRTRSRLAWWRVDATTLADGAVVPETTPLRGPDGRTAHELPPVALPAGLPRYTDDVPVIFGHYWRNGPLRPEGSKAVCIDYSAGKGGPLVAYRWSGEADLTADHLVAT